MNSVCTPAFQWAAFQWFSTGFKRHTWIRQTQGQRSLMMRPTRVLDHALVCPPKSNLSMDREEEGVCSTLQIKAQPQKTCMCYTWHLCQTTEDGSATPPKQIISRTQAFSVIDCVLFTRMWPEHNHFLRLACLPYWVYQWTHVDDL